MNTVTHHDVFVYLHHGSAAIRSFFIRSGIMSHADGLKHRRSIGVADGKGCTASKITASRKRTCIDARQKLRLTSGKVSERTVISCQIGIDMIKG